MATFEELRDRANAIAKRAREIYGREHPGEKWTAMTRHEVDAIHQRATIEIDTELQSASSRKAKP